MIGLIMRFVTRYYRSKNSCSWVDIYRGLIPRLDLFKMLPSTHCVAVLKCVAACCGVSRCVAACRGALQCVAVYRSVFQCAAVWHRMVQSGTVWHFAVQCGVECCGVLPCVAVCCSVLQCAAECSRFRVIYSGRCLPRSRNRHMNARTL